MKALILAAGSGERLRPLTDKTSKPMLPVTNVPILVHIIKYLAAAKITEIWINLHHFPASIEDEISNGKKWGVTVEYFRERQLSGTAGAVKRFEPFLEPDDQTFLVIHGCLLTTFDLNLIIDSHDSNHAWVTRLVDRLPESGSPLFRRPGVGLYIMDREVFRFISSGKYSKIELDLIPKIEDQGKSFVCYNAGDPKNQGGTFPLHKIRDSYDLIRANQRVVEEDRLIVVEDEFGGKDDPGLFFRDDPKFKNAFSSYEIQPPVLIGKNTHLEADVYIEGPTVIGENCRILEKVTLSKSIVLSDTIINRLTYIKNSIVTHTHLVEFDENNKPFVYSSEQIESIHDNGLSEFGYALFNKLGACLLLIVFLPFYLARIIFYMILGRRDRYLIQHETRIRKEGSASQLEAIRYTEFEHYSLRSDWVFWRRLPELNNVVRGDMNLVGHRPLTPNMAQRLDDEFQFIRLQGAPGWISPWETFAEKKDMTPEQKNLIENDHAIYHSIIRDIKILMKALLFILFSKDKDDSYDTTNR
ncbi:MAG: hypothetical protein B6244_03485 [Candidatus Cloacimonetes bacterium 4572_55]|nr:MAG: hypothetical protein B6244_03485 [Candidatus Cloacimonetes bacterium 4572_55]